MANKQGKKPETLNDILGSPQEFKAWANKVEEFHDATMICSNFGCPCLNLQKKLEMIVAEPNPHDGSF